MASENQLQLLSDEVQEIVGYKPGWVIRKGNFIFLLVLLILLAVAYLIKYPDIVKASVRITALTSPKILTANAEGQLEKLFVTNGQQVEKGQQLAYIKSTGKHEQVIQLQEWIIATKTAVNDTGVLVSDPLPVLNELGDLQQDYRDFQNNIPEIKEVMTTSYYRKPVSNQLVKNNNALRKKNKDPQNPGKIIYNQKQKLRSALLKLENKTEAWMQKYIIISPAKGKLEFASFMQESQLVNNGQQLFFLQQAAGKYYAEIKAGQNKFAKIKTGQKVVIRLFSYPSEEYGFINGKITYISSMPLVRDSFLIQVELPEVLKTSYDKEILLRSSLLGSAEIRIDEKRLIEKLFKMW